MQWCVHVCVRAHARVCVAKLADGSSHFSHFFSLSSPLPLSDACWQVILEFMHDWFRDDNPEADPSEPLYIVEAGAGLGKLAFLIVRELLAAREFYPEMCGGETLFRYVLTDCAPQNLAFWDGHDQLKPLFDLGVLDAALVDASVPGLGGEIRLTHSGDVISPGSPVRNPIFCICNYVINALPYDAFQIRPDGRIYMASCAARTSVADPLAAADEDEDTDDDGEEGGGYHGHGGISLKPHEIIQGLDCEWSYTPVHGDEFEPLFGNNKMLNAIPEAYRQLMQHGKREASKKGAEAGALGAASASGGGDFKQPGSDFSASFSVPSAGIMMLQSLARMVSGRRLAVLVGDKGYTRLSEMRSVLRNPHLARHGSFSAMVNFHALQLFVDQVQKSANSSGDGGSSSSSSSSNVRDGGGGGAFMRVSPFSEGFKTALLVMGMGAAEVPQSVWAFEDWAYSQGPDQLSSLQRHEGQQCPDAKLDHAIGLLRLCDYDPEVFLKFKKQFIRAVGDPLTPKQMRKDIGMLTDHVLSRHFTVMKHKDIWFELARIHMGLGQYRKAGVLFEMSNQKCGEHHVTHHNKGICLFYMGKLTEAKVAFQTSLARSPGYAEAVKWSAKVDEAMGVPKSTMNNCEAPSAASPEIV